MILSINPSNRGQEAIVTTTRSMLIYPHAGVVVRYGEDT